MKIDKDAFEKLRQLQQLAANNSSAEFEFRFLGESLVGKTQSASKYSMDRTSLTSLIKYLRSMPQKYVERPISKTVDVSLSLNDTRYRASFDVEEFRKKHTVANNVLVIAKSKMEDPVDMVDWNLRCSLNEEHVVDSESVRTELVSAAFASLYTSSQRVYRLKTRFSFVVNVSEQTAGAKAKEEAKVVVDRALTIDLTVVRQMKVGSSDAVDVEALFAYPETYEMEMEYTGIKNERDDLLRMFKQWSIALKVIYDVDTLLSLSDHRALVMEYAALTGQGVDSSKYKLFGPKLVTLEMHHLSESTSKQHVTVVDGNYAVTEKADGEHRLLYVSASGDVYTVDDRLNVRITGCNFPAFKNSLLEGEYLSPSISRVKTPSMLLFDAFYMGGRAVYGLPFATPDQVVALPVDKKKQPETRLAIVRAFASAAAGGGTSSCIDIKAKDFIGFSNAQELASVTKRLFARRDAGNYAYGVDGLIFTPLSYPVGADSASGRAVTVGTWTSSFKWKPPAFNTIDFLVRFRAAESELRDGELYRIADLYVSYNLPYLKPITSHMFLTNDIPVNKRRHFVPALFQPPDRSEAHVVRLRTEQSVDGGMVIKCEDGDELLDGTIVEFRWSQENDGEWIPIRVRHDKTEKYYKTREIAGTANKHETALSVWNSIMNPVTEDVICGRGVTDKELQSAVYYARSLSRTESKSAGLRAFHNRWVKGHHLLHRFRNKASSLVDFGCGRAGDLPKWQYMGLTKVLGLDLYADNIRNPKDGAHERALGFLKGRPACRGSPMMAFMQMDMSKRVTPDMLLNIDDADASGDKFVAQVLWGMVQTTAVTNQNLRAYHNFAGSGFDIVSCQFAVHYFFETDKTLDDFACNVSNFLKPGGYFVGTCLDAMKVNEALRDVSVGGSIEGGAEEGELVWQIVKLYDELSIDDPSKNIGLRVKVYMETIGQSLVEYLVDFRLLVQALSKYNVHPLTPTECSALFTSEGGKCMSTGTFEELFSDMRSHKLVRDVDAKSIELASSMSEAEMRYSFMNRWFMFRKH